MKLPQLVIKNEDENPTQLTSLAVDVEVSGLVAETTMTMIYSNSCGRALEGELMFPLPDGATVCGLALDIKGEMVDAVVTTKEKARVAFETAVRKHEAGPAIAEHVAGSTFKTRVYPVPANGSRIIRVQYVSQLDRDVDDAVYQLPFDMDEPLANLSVRVGVNVSEADIQPLFSSEDLSNDGEFVRCPPDEQRGEQWALSIQKKDVTTKGLTVTVPAVPSLQIVTEVDYRPQYREEFPENPEEQEPENQTYFVIDDTVFDEADGPADGDAAPASKVCVLWDTSRSQHGVPRTRYISLLESIIQKSEGDVEVDVVAFANVPEPVKSFTVSGGSAVDVLEYVSTLPYDGGTDLTLLPFREPGYAYFLLFSDGLGTLEQASLPKIFTAPVYAFNGVATGNHTLLRTLGRQSGGDYFNLSKVADNDEIVASVGASSNALTLISVDVTDGEVLEIYPSTATPIHNEHCTVAGRLAEGVKETTVKLNFGYGSNVTMTREYVIPAGAAAPGRIAPLIYAQQKLAVLLQDKDLYEDEILSLGRRFSLVTPNTSLIVLDKLSQFTEHKIEPPVTLPDLRDQYLREFRQKKESEERRVKAKIDRCAGWWATRLSWHKTDYLQRCTACDTIIRDMNKKHHHQGRYYHHTCFICQMCEAPLIGQNVYDGDNGGFVCFDHHLERTGAKCGECKADIRAANYHTDTQCTTCFEAAEAKRREAEAAARAALEAERAKSAKIAESEDSSVKKKEKKSKVGFFSRKKKSSAAEREEREVCYAEEELECDDDDDGGDLFDLQESCAAPAMSRSLMMDECLAEPQMNMAIGGAPPELRASSFASAPAPPPPSAGGYGGGGGGGRGGGFGGPPPPPGGGPGGPPAPAPVARSRQAAAAPSASLSLSRSAAAPAPPPEVSTGSGGGEGVSSSIAIKKWEPDMPYLNKIKAAAPDEQYGVYLELAAEEYAASPSFFLDCAELFFNAGDAHIGLRVLTNVVELGIDDTQLLRIVGYKLQTEGQVDAAVSVFTKVLGLRKDEPQSHRDLANALVERPNPDDWARAAKLYKTVIEGEWDGRFEEIEIVAMTEINRLFAVAEDAGCLDVVDVGLDDRLRGNTDADLRISMAWDTDMTDVDLHVIEPHGEEVYYSHKLSAQGGMISKDFTRGYGPEEYLCRDAGNGDYTVRAKYFSNSRQDASGATTVLVSVYTNWGRPGREDLKRLTLRLAESKDICDVGVVNFVADM